MAEGALDWNLLKAVSRSFYLTLRLLPGPVRESIALAYLLARWTDTEADGAETAGEKELLARKSELLQALARSRDQAEILNVWSTIQEGQTFDGKRFAANRAPLTAEELDRYTYLVAGCVGKFWTRLCFKRLPGFSREAEGPMAEWGVSFGKGLQLVNILRDRGADAALGRIYVRGEDVPVVLAQARVHLAKAGRYVRAVRIRRLRAACALPLALAGETLDLVEAAPDGRKVKVPRGRVWVLLARSLFF